MRVPEATPPASGAGLYFATPALTQRLELIRHLIDHSDRLVLVIGERHSGKSAFADQVLVRAPETWLVSRVHAHPMLDARALLRTFAASIGAAAARDDRKTLLEAIDPILRERDQKGLVSVLLVDDAHELPADALKLLFGGGCSGARALRVLLLCEPHINTMLEAPELQSLQETIVHAVDIPSFSPDQTQAFLEARYNPLASLRPLGGGEVRRIHRESGGSPGRIVELAQRALEQPPPRPAPDESSSRSIANHPGRLYTVAALLAAVSIIVAFDSLQGRFGSLASEEIAPAALSPLAPAPSGPWASLRPREIKQPNPESRPVTPASGKRMQPVPARQPSSDPYVLQLLASRDATAAERFLARYALDSRARILATGADGKRWHLVILGPFPDRRAASAAVRGLPPSIRAQRPWPRRMADLKALETAPRR